MRTREQRLWDSMKSHKPSYFALERIENLVGDGTPDVYFQVFGRHGWVELKASRSKGVGGAFLCSDSKVRVSQVGWHKEAAYYRTPTYILVRRETDGLVSQWLFPGAVADWLNEVSMKELLLNHIQYRCESWPDVYERLTGEKA